MKELRTQAILGNVKVKVFNELSIEYMQNKINDFLKDVMFIDVKYQVINTPVGMRYTALLTYAEYPF